MNLRDKEKGKSKASELVQSIFADPEALQLLRAAFTIPSEEAIKVSIESRPHNEPEVLIIDAGATKAPDSARTNDKSESENALNYQVAHKRSRSNVFPEADQSTDLVEFEDDLASLVSRWQASSELTHFIEFFRKPLESFDRKSICRKYFMPNVAAAYSLVLDSYICRLVSGVNQPGITEYINMVPPNYRRIDAHACTSI